MTWADNVNGTYEFIGGIFLLLNCIKLYRDKQIKGVTLATSIFFATWSWWNMYYYPSLNQWVSFSGGVLIAITNTAWVIMAIHYIRRKYKDL